MKTHRRMGKDIFKVGTFFGANFTEFTIEELKLLALFRFWGAIFQN